jgi:hypothetical protein
MGAITDYALHAGRSSQVQSPFSPQILRPSLKATTTVAVTYITSAISFSLSLTSATRKDEGRMRHVDWTSRDRRCSADRQQRF